MAAFKISDGWELPQGSITFSTDNDNCIGEGGFGKVFRGEMNGLPVAVKKLHVQNLTSRARKEFLHEIELISKLRHPALVTFFGAVNEPGHFAMVMELMEGGSLYHLLHDDEKELSWLRKCYIIKEVCSGVQYLHSKHIIHRDLKSLNVLLNQQLNPKLCDFGLAIVKTDTESQVNTRSKSSTIGTSRWLSPEIMQGRKHSYKSDMWSFGLIALEVATREIPFHSIVEVALVANLSNASATNFPTNIPDDCPDDLRQFIEICLYRDPVSRPEADFALTVLNEVYNMQVQARRAANESYGVSMNSDHTSVASYDMNSRDEPSSSTSPESAVPSATSERDSGEAQSTARNRRSATVNADMLSNTSSSSISVSEAQRELEELQIGSTSVSTSQLSSTSMQVSRRRQDIEAEVVALKSCWARKKKIKGC